MNLFAALQNIFKEHFKPDANYSRAVAESYTVDSEKLAFYVGVVALSLPITIIMSNKLGLTIQRDTISHYQYSILLGDAFVIALGFIGTFLIAYRGESANETIWATIAGWFTYAIALFPTKGSGIEGNIGYGRVFSKFSDSSYHADRLEILGNKLGRYEFEHYIWAGEAFNLFAFSSWFNSAVLHGLSTGVLFVFLSVFSCFVFTRIKINHRINGNLTPEKTRRNLIYTTTGIVILICILSITIAHIIGKIYPEFGVIWRHYNTTFILEAIALWTFGIAWLVKGKFLGINVFWLKWTD